LRDAEPGGEIGRQRHYMPHGMTDRTASPLLPACKLWEKTSANGTRPEGESDATHVLMFTEAAPMQPRQSSLTLPRPAPAPRRELPMRRNGRNAPTHRIEDDGIPF
jgi:hypothetical protein